MRRRTPYTRRHRVVTPSIQPIVRGAPVVDIASAFIAAAHVDLAFAQGAVGVLAGAVADRSGAKLRGMVES